jgi:hypothetical protein
MSAARIYDELKFARVLESIIKILRLRKLVADKKGCTPLTQRFIQNNYASAFLKGF